MLVCSNPITLTKDGETLRVPCGKCRYCLQQKANRLATQLTLEANTSHVLFVTLTYDDAHLPRVKVKPSLSDGYVHAYTDKPQNFQFSTKSDKNYKSVHHGKIDPKIKYYPRYVPILCRSHVVNFVKRCRRQLEYNGIGQIRHYYCGEYGFRHHRPHYHALFYCQSEEQMFALKQIVHKSWHYGIVDCQRARSSVSGYLGSYLSCSNLCTGQLWQIVYPPFCGHSIRLGFESVRHIIDNTISQYCQNPQGSLYDRLSKQSVTLPGNCFSLPLWQTYLNSFLPKLPSFSKLGIHLSLRLYQSASRIFEKFGGFEGVVLGLIDYNRGFFKSSLPHSLIEFYEDCNAVFARFSKYDVSQCFNDKDVTWAVQEIQLQWLYKLLSASRNFCKMLTKYKISAEKYYQIITSFYDDLNKSGLIKQLIYQSEYYKDNHKFFYYTNLKPTTPIHDAPPIVISIRSSLDLQITKSIIKKSHLF